MLGKFPQRFAQSTLRNSVGVISGGYIPEARDYFARAETLDADAFDQTSVDPTQTEAVNKKQIDTVVRGLKDASLWSPLVEAWWFRDTSFTALPTKLKHSAAFPELVNRRMYFDGVDDYVNTSLSSGEALTGFTIAAKAVNEDISGRFASTRHGAGEGFILRYSVTNGYELVVHTSAGVVVLNSGAVSLLEETEVVGTWDGTTARLYVNKTEVDSSALAGTMTTSSNLKIGASENTANYFFTGTVYDVRLYSSAKTSGEVSNLYDSAPTGELASYTGYGNTSSDWLDNSGNGYNGTVNGSPALYTGQGGNSAIVTLNNYVSADYLSEGTDPGLLGNDSTKTETTSYTATVTGSIAVFTANGSFYGECEIPASYTSSEYNLGRKECLFIFNRALTSGERTSLETIMVNQGARPFGLKAGVTSLSESFRGWSILTSFDDSWDTGSVTNFELAWFQNSLTSFPLLDTSSGTNFYIAWAYNSLTSFPPLDTSSGTNFRAAWRSNSLTSFPLLDTSSGTNFIAAWRDNPSLTDFPANFFDAWNPASISSGVFDFAWAECTSLTSTSVENILASLDTSGKYGTTDGTSTGTVLADNTIDIDYDGSGLTAATETAIDNLLSKSWKVSINGVLYEYATESETYFTSAETLDADAFDQTAVDPTQTEAVNKKQIDTVVKGLQSANLWTPLVEAWWFRDTSFTAAPVKLKYESDSTLTLNNYVSGDYLSEGTDPGLLGDGSTKTETTSYTATVTGSIAVFTANGSFYGECEIPAAYTSSPFNLGRKEALFIFNRALTAGERTSLETIMVNQGARPFGLKAGVTSLYQSFRAWSILTSFDDSWDTGAVTSFGVAWYQNSLTSFPLINTSSGTNFRYAWYQNSLTSFPLIDTSSGTGFRAAWYNNSLTSFPLLNTSSGTNFSYAWRGNSLLEDFPAGFFDTWNPASITSGVFDFAWDGCTSLTSTSVENILVSLDTSGKYGTGDGTSTGTVLADNTIDIDYDGSGLTAATNTAITNLKAKDWQVEINGVLQ